MRSPWRQAATAILSPMACAIKMEASMGDKSPKAKQRDQKQKDAAKAGSAAQAKAKQDRSTQPQPPAAQGKQ